MADKYLYINTTTGDFTERAAVTSSAGAGDAGKIPGLDGTGKLDTSFMPVGIGADTQAITTSEALAAGDLVNVWSSTGAKARKADATAAGKKARGFVLASVISGGTATVYFEGTITGLTGLTAGAEYFLSTTAGTPTATPPTGSGNVIQSIGVATSTTTINFEPGPVVVLA